MVPLAADENVDDRLLRGLQRRAPDLDMAGQPLPGVIMIPQTEAIGVIIDGILELLTSHDAADLRDRIAYPGL